MFWNAAVLFVLSELAKTQVEFPLGSRSMSVDEKDCEGVILGTRLERGLPKAESILGRTQGVAIIAYPRDGEGILSIVA